MGVEPNRKSGATKRGRGNVDRVQLYLKNCDVKVTAEESMESSRQSNRPYTDQVIYLMSTDQDCP